MRKAVGLVLLASLFLACGGGGGGKQEPRLSLSVSPAQVTVQAGVGESAPSSYVTLTVTASEPYGQNLYLVGDLTRNGLDSVQPSPQSASTVLVMFSFKSPASLAPGVYSDTVTLGVTKDQGGTQHIGNSPVTIPVTYTVTPAPSPAITTIAPVSVTAGTRGVVLTLNGSSFAYNSSVQWDGAARATTYVNQGRLTAQLFDSDTATPGTHTITVSNGSEVVSAPATFTVTAVPFGVARISPDNATVGSGAFTLTVTGAQFSNQSVVRWNGSDRPTTFVSATTLTAAIPASDVTAKGKAQVTVVNPAGAGGTSNAVTFAINSPEATSFLNNPSHSGAITFSSATLPDAPLWTATLDGPPSYPIIAQGLVIVTATISGGSELVAYRADTGAKAWGPVMIQGRCNAAYDDGRIFVVQASYGGGAATIASFDAATGTPSWSATMPGQYSLDAGLTAANGKVYATQSGIGVTLYAFDQTGGGLLWTRVMMAGGSCTPAVTSNAVYCTYPMITQAFDANTGESLWSQFQGGDGGGGATPVVANGVIYAPDGFGTYDGRTYDAATGTLLGTYSADMPPAIGPSIGYFLQAGTLRGIGLANRTILWSFAGDGNLCTSPLLVNGFLFAGSSSGKLYALDAVTGAQLASWTLGGAIPRGAGWGAGIPLSGLGAGNGLLVVPAGNTLTAFQLAPAP